VLLDSEGADYMSLQIDTNTDLTGVLQCDAVSYSVLLVRGSVLQCVYWFRGRCVHVCSVLHVLNCDECDASVLR